MMRNKLLHTAELALRSVSYASDKAESEVYLQQSQVLCAVTQTIWRRCSGISAVIKLLNPPLGKI